MINLAKMLKFVYITVGSKTEARQIAKALLDERLAACVNIIPGVDSMFWWEGKIQEEAEVVMIAKTKASLVQDLIDTVEELHSYDVPCIEVLNVEIAGAEYESWVEEETR